MNAAANAVVISTINAAVEARVLSSKKDERVAAAAPVLNGPDPAIEMDKEELVQKVPRCSLCFQDHLLCAGTRPHQGRQRGTRLGSQSRFHGTDLARRMHHPCPLPERHYRGLPA